MTRHFRSLLRVTLLALLATAGTARAAVQAFDLWAKPGTLTLPPAVTAPVWGFALAAADPAAVPGPALLVNQGDLVTVTLHNGLAEPVALTFGGQPLPGPAAAAPGGTASYTFTAGAPGTFLYEAGPLPQTEHQAPMGLYGALVVRPTSAPDVPVAGQAYADPATAFDDEALVVMSELDTALNAAVAAGQPYDLRSYAPRYYLLNGRAHPATGPIATAAGHRVLLRYLNAGLQHHSMALLGLNQTVVAVDGAPRAFGQAVVAETVAPGQTMDAITTIPALAAAGSRFALYDGSLKLYNGTGAGPAAGLGGMLTFLSVAGGGPGAPAPATTSGVALAPSPANGAVAVTVSATVAVAAGAVTAAEFFVDAMGAAGGGTAMSANDGAFGGASEGVGAAIPPSVLAGLASGSHTVYVHGQTGGGWGPFNFAVLVLDKTGPAATGPVLTPAVVGAGRDVAVHATGDDTATGGGVIAAAEYAIDGGAPVGMTVNVAATVASLDGIIPAAAITALVSGPHAVAIRSQDALGNWGAPASLTLTVDRVGPTTSGLAVAPNPGDGTAALHVTASLADGAGVVAAEGFVDGAASPAPGSGFPLVPADGAFGGTTEAASADLPQATVAALAVGTHTLRVRGKDAAGNWGALASTSFGRSAQAVADALTITSTTSSTPQQVNVAAPGLLANDLPNVTGRTTTLASGPVRTAGTGTGTIAVTCGGATATGVCSNGSYRVTLTPGPGNAAARQASKRGTYQFTYRTTLNGVQSAPATVTITVN